MDNRAKQADRLDYNDILARFDKQFDSKASNSRGVMNFQGMWDTLRSNYSSYFLSLGEIKTYSSHIEGPRIGLCSSNAQL